MALHPIEKGSSASEAMYFGRDAGDGMISHVVAARKRRTVAARVPAPL
jgi:hypothetical protein